MCPPTFITGNRTSSESGNSILQQIGSGVVRKLFRNSWLNKYLSLSLVLYIYTIQQQQQTFWLLLAHFNTRNVFCYSLFFFFLFVVHTVSTLFREMKLITFIANLESFSFLLSDIFISNKTSIRAAAAAGPAAANSLPVETQHPTVQKWWWLNHVKFYNLIRSNLIFAPTKLFVKMSKKK